MAAGSEASEKEILKLGTNPFEVTADEKTGAVTVTIRAYEETGTDSNNKKTYTGNYLVDFYAGAIGKDDVDTAKRAITQKITYEDMGYKAYDADADDKTNMLEKGNRLPQKSEALYANVYAKKTLNGTFKFIDDYSEAEVVEE